MKLDGDSELKDVLGKMIDKSADAMAYSLTSLAFDIRYETQKKLPQWVDMTRPFLSNMVKYDRATASSLSACVGFDKQVKLAMLLEQGGTRTPTNSKSIAVPVDVRTNKSGNVSASQKPGALLNSGKQNIYIKYQGGVMGLWQSGKRASTPTKLLYVFKRQTQYKHPFFHFFDTAQSVIQTNSQAKFEQSVQKMIEK
jgi:hypothetical protein